MPHLVIDLDGESMARLLSPGGELPTDLIERGDIIVLGDDAEIVVNGMENATQSGAPGVVVGFALPDGRRVVAQLTWRLFATCFHSLAGKFGTPYPDLKDMELIHGGAGSGMKYELVGDDDPRYMECQVCGERREFASQNESADPWEPSRWMYQHFLERHPDWTPPVQPPPGESWG